MKMGISVGRYLKIKTMLVWVNEYISKTLQFGKVFVLARIIYYFKKEGPNGNIGFSKFCTLRPKWCVLPGSKIIHSVYICSAYQNVVASRCNELGLDIQRPDLEDRLEHWEQKIHHASVWILSWHCNSERISWSGAQRTWRWWDI